MTAARSCNLLSSTDYPGSPLAMAKRDQTLSNGEYRTSVATFVRTIGVRLRDTTGGHNRRWVPYLGLAPSTEGARNSHLEGLERTA